LIKIQLNTKKWQKSVKNHQHQKTVKLTKSEKWKSDKNQKTRKCKIDKIRKVKKWQKWWKKWPPLKMAKMSDKWPKTALCEIRAAWSGVFWVPGGTTGPGFKAEIRPPLFLHFFDIKLCIFHFYDLCILMFLCFSEVDKLHILWKWSNFGAMHVMVIRPYGN